MPIKGPLFLIGDSNMVSIGRAAKQLGIAVRGGPIGIGVDFEKPFYATNGKELSLLGKKREQFQDEFRDILTFDGPVLSTLGFNAHRFAIRIHKHCADNSAATWSDLISRQVFEQSVQDSREHVLSFYRLLAEHDRRVFFVHSPQRAPAPCLPILRDFEQTLIPLIEATGARLVDVRRQITDENGPLETFAEKNDPVHGNVRFGEVVLTKLGKLLHP